jgi:hypothetical protein
VADQPDTSVLVRETESPLASGGGLFCGVTEEAFAINGVTYSWPRGSRLKWGIAFSRLGELSDMDVKDTIVETLKEISACCDVSHEYVANPNAANLRIETRRLDGQSGVLADCQIPVGNVSTDTTTLQLRLDDSEAWGLYDNPPAGRIDLYRVLLHEFEHGHGLGHKPPSIQLPALISPVYSPVMRHLQAADISELVRRYGAPQLPPPPPAGGPRPVNFKGIGEIEQDGKKWRGNIEGIIQRVT